MALVDRTTEGAQILVESSGDADDPNVLDGPGSSAGVLQIKDAVAEAFGVDADYFARRPWMSLIAYRLYQKRYEHLTTPVQNVPRKVWQWMAWYMGVGNVRSVRKYMRQRGLTGVDGLLDATEATAKYVTRTHVEDYIDKALDFASRIRQGKIDPYKRIRREARKLGVSPHPLWYNANATGGMGKSYHQPEDQTRTGYQF